MCDGCRLIESDSWRGCTCTTKGGLSLLWYLNTRAALGTDESLWGGRGWCRLNNWGSRPDIRIVTDWDFFTIFWNIRDRGQITALSYLWVADVIIEKSIRGEGLSRDRELVVRCNNGHCCVILCLVSFHSYVCLRINKAII